jgi:transketolase
VRDAFVRELTRIAAEDDRVVVLTADLGIGLFDELASAAPDRFLNVGIAEQNMVGIAAGLALAGRKVFAYSIAPFITSRPHDQVRIDVAYHGADVTLVGVGGGVSYGAMGPTHHAIEDIALMRALPGLTVLTPGDPNDAYLATLAAAEIDGPVYLRLGKNGEPSVLPEGTGFVIGRAVELRSGCDVAILSAGTILPEALAAADQLAARGIDATLAHFGTVKPLDVDAVLAAAARCPRLVTAEEHTVMGGFGSAVAEVLAEHGCPARLHRVGLRDEFAHEVGSRTHLVTHYRLDADAIASAAGTLLATSQGAPE